MNITQRARLVRQHATVCDNRNTQSAAGAYKEPIRRPGMRSGADAGTGRASDGSSSVHSQAAAPPLVCSPMPDPHGIKPGHCGRTAHSQGRGTAQGLPSPPPLPPLPLPPLPLSVSCISFPPLPRRHTERGAGTGPAPHRGGGCAAQRAARMPRTGACRARSR